MGNCLASHDTWTRLRRKQFDFSKIMKDPSAARPNRIAFQITNVVNVPGATGVVTTAPAADNSVVGAPAANDVVVVQADVSAEQNDVVSTVVSRIIADAPTNMENLQITSFRNVSIFTYNELSMATSQFRPDLILGEGGFGLVYKGVIDGAVRPGFHSTVVAVKELNPDGYQGDREWLTEVNYLGQLSHPNLVTLIGYCCEDEHRLLIYEYMACGSLERHLFRRHNTLSWSTRMKIALDAAKGLAFLHEAERPIIYRDFKTSNILLDAEFNAKLSDFGLAKEGPMGDQTHVSTRVMGTYGYAAPEYIMTGHLTARSDVYSFGVVLLELIVGKRALDKSRPSHEKNLVEWARPLLIRATKLLRIVDPRMEGQYSSKTASMVANLAHRCLSENPKTRPTMSEVVKDLEMYNQEEMLIQSYGAQRKLEEALGGEATTNNPSAEEVNRHEPSKRGTNKDGNRKITPRNANGRDGHSNVVVDYQHPNSSDSNGQLNHSGLVSKGVHILPNSNGIHNHSRSGRNSCSPSDGLQRHSRSVPNVGISGCG